MITIAQCRMARAAVNWSINDLADAAEVGRATIVRFESGKGAPNRSTLAAIRRAFETAGVVLFDELAGERGDGVWLRTGSAQGPER